MIAILKDDVASLRKLLEQNSGTVDIPLGVLTKQATPFLYAASKGKVGCLQFLIEQGASIQAKDIEGDNALSGLLKTKRPSNLNEVLDVLLEKGVEVLEKDKKGLIEKAKQHKCPLAVIEKIENPSKKTSSLSVN